MKSKCTFDPTNIPIGQFHCPVCGEMIIGGMPHLPSLDDVLENMTEKELDDIERMAVYGTCGHEVEYFGDLHTVTLPAYTIDFDADGMVRCTTTVSLCSNCYNKSRSSELLTKDMEMDWIEGRTNYDWVW